MKGHRIQSRKAIKAKPTVNHHDAGPGGLAMQPPSYGINVLDRGLIRPLMSAVSPSVIQAKQLPHAVEQQIDGQGNGPSPAPLPQTSIPQAGEPAVQRRNKTGLPDNLKSGIETLSSISLDDVSVHYNPT